MARAAKQSRHAFEPETGAAKQSMPTAASERLNGRPALPCLVAIDRRRTNGCGGDGDGQASRIPEPKAAKQRP